jgi:hypothetical protein
LNKRDFLTRRGFCAEKDSKRSQFRVFRELSRPSDTYTQGGVSSELYYTTKVAPTQASSCKKIEGAQVQGAVPADGGGRNLAYTDPVLTQEGIDAGVRMLRFAMDLWWRPDDAQ